MTTWTRPQMTAMLDWGLHIAARLYPGRIPQETLDAVWSPRLPVPHSPCQKFPSRGDSPSDLVSTAGVTGSTTTGGIHISPRLPADPAQPDADTTNEKVTCDGIGWAAAGRWEHGLPSPGAVAVVGRRRASGLSPQVLGGWATTSAQDLPTPSQEDR